MRLVIAALVLLLLSSGPAVFGQNIKFERDRHRSILRFIKDDVKKHYYDPNLRGIDIEANFKTASEKIMAANSIGQINGIIAQFLLDFDDSHLFYIPPQRAFKTDYGFDFRMFGDKCFVTNVVPKSAAEKSGLKVGDEILSFQSFTPTRETLWQMRYFYFILNPGPAIELSIARPDGKEVEISVPPDVTPGRIFRGQGDDLNTLRRESVAAQMKEQQQFIHDKVPGVFIWRMPSFSIEPSQAEGIVGRAKDKETMILDLRGNGGGRVDMLLRLIGTMFDKDIAVGTEKLRKESKEVIAKSRGKALFSGRLIVLVDSGSGSASEIFARVVQLEKRGEVIGERTAGAVMKSMIFDRLVGAETGVLYGLSITVSDLIMKDGKSLEKAGVYPDVTVLPTGADIATKRDVVLSKALEMVGVAMTPEQAGSMFPSSR
ncbi:MAG: PDZ domain-containing protein [Acidobacteria bacterium]|nr:PDZ domain-containing protein [Acidobacteriota bacterium]